MDGLLHCVCAALIRKGTLQVTTARGRRFTVGDGTGTPLAVRFSSVAAEAGVLLDPELRLGEAYMDGTLVVEEGSIADLLALALSQEGKALPRWTRPQWVMRFLQRRVQQFNGCNRARRNVAHHYDLDGRLYSLFLDPDQQYSCGYFERPDQSLDDAQLAKKRHLAAKLLVHPNNRVLDIGSGWGGLALYLAEICGAQTVGITLSEEQLALSNIRAADNGLSNSVEFRLQDYRDVAGRFDRIVSVGMFEHVGVGFYDAFFHKIVDLLADDGVVLLHSIGRSERPGITNPWIAKHIFPGGYIPALSEVLPAIERAGLLVTDIEILRLHYADTLKAWRERFLARRQEAERLYDERFVRMWEFYLAASEMAFRHEAMMIFQIQMTKRQDVVPVTRDYVAREEARLQELEDRSHLPFGVAAE
ncbi:MAG: cyclopropane-fatty-acyl-phospholipid synthase family protein [Bradyrhizobium sp.]|uniref:cyclopropane-fatty-acyl-phospholipid synthase family protein n=1 Tax=Bradyrhizobium sp. TaxID=376 RepID=UPI0029A33736|nr:cyclopropane-fatty-acyl-phospholipid synthase family protein [Bradyrhizobium sp.]MDX3966869.1 cyclopropane-fatty-acyl-phospholipid synthase family protein [Bradyrhizobium sp.]